MSAPKPIASSGMPSMQDLLIIKGFILQCVEEFLGQGPGTDDSPDIIPNLSDFLDRLINNQEGHIHKDSLQIKAGKQLLCSIGIDLLTNAVPVEKYLAIFEKLDYNNIDEQACKLFSDCILDNHLVYRETDKRITNDFSIILCPINDISYYANMEMLGIVQLDQKSFAHKKLLEAASEHLSLKTGRFDKGHHCRHFWTTTQKELDRIMSLKNTTNHIVDQLGLSQFNFDDESYQYFFYIKLGDYAFETFKPNATVVNWSDPKVGYISYDDRLMGKTFSISGYVLREVGMAERVFHILEIEKDKLRSTAIIPLTDALVPPIEIDCNDIVSEAVKRFKENYKNA